MQVPVNTSIAQRLLRCLGVEQGRLSAVALLFGDQKFGANFSQFLLILAKLVDCPFHGNCRSASGKLLPQKVVKELKFAGTAG